MHNGSNNIITGAKRVGLAFFVVALFAAFYVFFDISFSQLQTDQVLSGIVSTVDAFGGDGGGGGGGGDGGGGGESGAGCCGGETGSGGGGTSNGGAGGSTGGGTSNGGAGGESGSGCCGGETGGGGGTSNGGAGGESGPGCCGGETGGGPEGPGNETGGGEPVVLHPACTLTASKTLINKGESATLTWTSQNVTSGSINEGVGSLSPVSGGSRSVSPDDDTTFLAQFTGPHGSVNCQVTIHVETPAPKTPACTLTASDTRIEKGDNVSLTWTSRNVTSGEMNEGIGSLSPVSGGSVTDSPNDDTTYRAEFTGPHGSVTCKVSVDVDEKKREDEDLACTLRISPSRIEEGESATLRWTSENADEGEIDHGVGELHPVDEGSERVSPRRDTTYTATFRGDEGTVRCDAEIEVDEDDGGGGGGSRRDPRVTLSSEITSEPLTYVTLTQVPYTGFPSGPVTTALFWTGLVVWSGLVAYAVSVKGVGAAYIGAFMSRFGFVPRRARASALVQDQGEEIDAIEGTGANHFNADAVYYHMSQAYAAPDLTDALWQPDKPSADADEELHRLLNERDIPENLPVERAAPAAASSETDSTLQDQLESIAYREGVLLSAEGMHLVMNRGRGTLAGASQFLTQLIGLARVAYPREDGWLHLNRERIVSLLGEEGHEIAHEAAASAAAPAADAQSVSQATAYGDHQAVAVFVGWMCDRRGDQVFEFLRTLKLQGASSREFLGRVVSALDEAYRNRLEGGRPVDAFVVEKTNALSTQDIAALIDLLSVGVDYSYKDSHTGVKTALVRAVEYLESQSSKK